jgi:hypothetical protein
MKSESPLEGCKLKVVGHDQTCNFAAHNLQLTMEKNL